MRDLNKKHLFEVHENGKGINDIYHLIMTDTEMSEFLKNKNAFYGYIDGVGGDKSYNAWAVYADC